MHRPKLPPVSLALSKSCSFSSDLDLHYLQVQAECHNLEALYYSQTHSGHRPVTSLSSRPSVADTPNATDCRAPSSFHRQWSEITADLPCGQATAEDAQDTLQLGCHWKLSTDDPQALELLAEQVTFRHRELHTKQEQLQTQRAKFKAEKAQFVQLLARLEEDGQYLLAQEKSVQEKERELKESGSYT